jgi:hypothetical protein
MRVVYTQEHLDFLREHYPNMLVDALTAAFNQRFGVQKTEVQIKSTLKRHNIKCGRATGNQKGVLRAFTKEQHDWICEAYKEMSLVQMTEAFNQQFGTTKTVKQIRSFTRNHSIRSGRDGKFEKGHVPANKGTKGMMKANKTSFKKGNKPANVSPMWKERITKDGYIEIKVPERNPYTGFMGRYVLKHKWIWQKEKGSVPDGYALMFLDGDKRNCDIANLALVKRAELLLINRQFPNLPAKLIPTAIGIAQVSVKARELSRCS